MISFHTSPASIVVPPTSVPAPADVEDVNEASNSAAMSGDEESNQQSSEQPKQSPSKSNQLLDQAQQQQIRELKIRDREVRAHEAAHLGAAGALAKGGASFEFTTGPDGRSYAVGGEVQIDTSPVPGDPQATLAKAQKIIAAANAPAHPSSQDQSVAAQAASMATTARAEISQLNTAENAESKSKVSSAVESAREYASVAEIDDEDAPVSQLDMMA